MLEDRLAILSCAAALLGAERICYVWIARAPERFRALCAGSLLSMGDDPITAVAWLFYGFTEDEAMEHAAWRYLRWFYEQMDVVLVPSRAYRQQLIAKGLDPKKLRLFPHGTDLQTFHPGHRDPSFWSKYGAGGGPKVTYVGRVAKEKDLDVLIGVYDLLARRRPDCTLSVVGDGPFLEQMKQALVHPNVVFTGFLFNEGLSAAYASSDVLVFPSTTDTFGSVVLEAMASGVPVIVSDRGAPASSFSTEGRGS